MVVDTDDRSGEGSYLTEGDEYRIVYLSLGSKTSAEEEECDTGKCKRGSNNELYGFVIVHYSVDFEIRCKGSIKKRNRQI